LLKGGKPLLRHYKKALIEKFAGKDEIPVSLLLGAAAYYPKR
jgi:hypothetical protein